MKLIDLIGPLKRMDTAEQLAEKELPGIGFDTIDIFVVETLDPQSEIKFFDAESIPGTMYMEFEGITYVEFFPLVMAQEMVQAYAEKHRNDIDDAQIMRRILDYRIKDA